MGTLEKRSPDGKVAIELRYEGEVRFGPMYFSCAPVGFSADFSELLISENVEWKPDASSCVMLIFHSLRSDEAPDNELIRVDIESGEIHSIERNTEGMIRMGGFDQSGKYSYEVISREQRTPKCAIW